MPKTFLDSLRSKEDFSLLAWGNNKLTKNEFLDLVEDIRKNFPEPLPGQQKTKTLIDIERPDLFYATFFATIASGQIAVLPNKDYLERGYVFPFIDQTVSLVDDSIAFVKNNSLEPADVPKQVECIIFSSGSTGKPKGICQSLESLIKNAEAVSQQVQYKQSIIPLKAYLVSAVAHFMGHLIQGAELIFIDEKTSLADFNKLSESIPEAGLVGSPIHLVRYATSFSDKSTPPYFFSSGDFIFASTIRKILKVHPGSIFYKVYGVAELGGRFFVNRISETMSDLEMDSIGQSISIAQPLFENGEIKINSDLLFSGYLIETQFTSAPRPYPTGDLYEDINGLKSLAGRVSDEVKVGGQKVLLSQLNKKVSTQFEENSFAIIPKPHPLFGNLLCFVTQDPSQTRVALRERLLSIMDKSEVPQEYYFTEHIPRTGSGKLDRKQTSQLLEGFKKLV